MNWINNVVRPKIRSIWNKREVPDNLWIKCPETGEMVFHRDLEANQFVIPTSGHHMSITGKQRFKTFFDDGAYALLPVPQVPADPLKFRDQRRYTDRLKDARNKTGLDDAVLVATGALHGLDIVAAVQDFSFMAGSLGMAAGESIILAAETARERKSPFILFAASGGARMQEGVLSLMQLPRTTVAIRALTDAGLPYIVVLTHPTTGGVTASYAMLGDIHLAEPGALIGFAGPRVIKQTIRETLPDGFQRSEYLREHGMVDAVVHRHDLRPTISRLCRMMLGLPAAEDEAPGASGEGAPATVAPPAATPAEAPAPLAASEGAAAADAPSADGAAAADAIDAPGDQRHAARVATQASNGASGQEPEGPGLAKSPAE